jgi:hypothetical protein
MQCERTLVTKKKFQCLACDKLLSSKQRLMTHEETCKEYQASIEKEKEESYLLMLLKEKDEKIKELERLLNSNNKRENIPKKKILIEEYDNVTDDIINTSVEKLQIQDVANGPDFLASFAVNKTFKNCIMCTDFSRQIIKYKNESGMIITEPYMTNLSERFFKAIVTKAEDLLNKEILKLNDEDNDDTTTSLLCTDLAIQKIKIKKCASGKRIKYFQDFARHVCRLTVFASSSNA